MMPKTAILIDGGFYRLRSRKLWGDKSASDRADELIEYARFHIMKGGAKRLEGGRRSLYRIFYYDCPPLVGRSVWQPWNGRNTTFEKSNEQNKWATTFHEQLSKRTKVAMRMGNVMASNMHYVPREEAIRDLSSGKRAFPDLLEKDFDLVGMKQAGVDMRIGLDVASLSSSGIVEQIILISDDTDFVPAAKYARRSGVDFLIDPMGCHMTKELEREVDDVEDLSKVFKTSLGSNGHESTDHTVH